MATRFELLGEVDSGKLGADKDDGGIEIILHFQHAGQRLQLVGAAHLPVALADGRHRGSGGADLHLLRLALVALGDAADLIGHGRREQRSLARRWRVFEDPFDVVDETHAQHLVAFVKHQRPQVVEHQALALQMVHDATRRADNDMGAARQRAQLDDHALAAIERQDVKAGHVVGVFLKGFRDLDRQFARWRQHQSLRPFVGEIELCQYGQRECGCFAGAGLRLTEHVSAIKQNRNAGGLDGRRRLVADVGKGGKECGRQLKRREGIDGVCHGIPAARRGMAIGGAVEVAIIADPHGRA